MLRWPVELGDQWMMDGIAKRLQEQGIKMPQG